MFLGNGVTISVGRNYSISIRTASHNRLVQGTSSMGNAELLVNDPRGSPILGGRCELGINAENAVRSAEFRPCDPRSDELMARPLSPLTELGNCRIAIGLGDDSFHKLLACTDLITCLE